MTIQWLQFILFLVEKVHLCHFDTKERIVYFPISP